MFPYIIMNKNKKTVRKRKNINISKKKYNKIHKGGIKLTVEQREIIKNLNFDPDTFKSISGRGTLADWAVKNGNSEIFKLTPKETWSKVDKHGFTPVHRAVIKKQLDIVKFIAKKEPAAFKIKGANGSTPVHIAAGMGNFEIFKLTPKETWDNEDNEGKTPIQIANDKGHSNILEYIKSQDETNVKEGGKKSRKHKAIHQSGGNKGRLKKGYRYSGKKLKSGLPQIVKCKKKS